MIEWEETDSGFRVFDRTKTEVCIDADGWSTADAGHDIDRPLDATVSGYASELRLPAALVFAFSGTSNEKHTHGGDSEPLELPDDEYLLDVNLNIKTYLKFSGPATVRKTDDYNDLIVSFPGRTQVTFGFRSHYEEPVDTITVPPTPEGVATAVTYASASHKTVGPDRSYPNLRGHPPRLELGGRTEIPDHVVESRADVGIELAVPDDFEYVFVAAPLAYYLQAELRVEDRQFPVLRAPEAGVEHRFTPLPGFQHEVADTLRRVFFLDCLVRNAGEYSWDLAELDLLDRLDLDAEETYHSTPAKQLATYLDARYERIDEDLPEWHLAMHVEPVADSATSLPYFLNNLSLVYLPESTELEKEELLNKSIDDFYRAGDPTAHPQQAAAVAGAGYRAGAGTVRSVDRRDPVLHEGQINGWLADGVPIDVFKAVPEAYENRFKYIDQGEGDIDVTVVLNDDEMVDEHDTVADIYQERAEDLPIDVTVHEHLSKRELADVLESAHDFVHYIGHCEEDGLRCRNGHLAVEDIAESNVQTFFLNACGSYYEGRDLVRKGSAAGAVTFTKVLNKQAAKVGVAFARLLIHGFSIQRALQLARRRIMMGKDYAVVGDGTYVLTQSDNRYPTSGTIEEADGAFDVQFTQTTPRSIGGGYQIYLPDDDGEEMYLHGKDMNFTLNRSELRSFLDRAKAPFVYDGDLYWSNELSKILES
ncbi:hypothetical protein NGM10_14260 [Halorussus salilacus]|uniref:hypothetical protein n=1 Tax=Halorussus salilacus TaxID=2953750 RepID=UPI00209FA8EE|nr:hypothetical protein [Halorussus salilacus]USZ67883.1 hypothetical protein NGM10_14260 [Halorussus salilacus]